jgi:hypothetical protein
MSAANESGSTGESGLWLDRWWGLLLILFGAIFVSILVTFHPTM